MRASRKNYWLWLKWLAVFLIPLPVAQATSDIIADGLFDADSIGSFNHELRELYGSLGLGADPFFWSWTTIYLLMNGIPYAVLVLVVRALVFRDAHVHCDRDSLVVVIAKWIAIVCLPLPVTICLYRLVMPGLERIEVALISDVSGYLLFRICLPLAIVAVLLHAYLFRRLPSNNPR
ncbi:MAG: hypothetical protein FJ271_29360 [Planctomycetes bacterium]|nr:hypothetical protein [Planctomycetota bacterium]